MPPDEKATHRDEMNMRHMFARCEEVTHELLYDRDRLDRGDFFIARIIWNEKKEQFHDHAAILEERYITHKK